MLPNYCNFQNARKFSHLMTCWPSFDVFFKTLKSSKVDHNVKCANKYSEKVKTKTNDKQTNITATKEKKIFFFVDVPFRYY